MLYGGDCFNALSSSEWGNAIILARLIFLLPASNGKLERVFSQLNVIKSNKRTSFKNDTLDDLLVLAIDSVPLSDFCPDSAIELWWKDKVRRPSQSERKEYNTTASSSTTIDSLSDVEVETEEQLGTGTTLFKDWDEWIGVCDEDYFFCLNIVY